MNEVYFIYMRIEANIYNSNSNKRKFKGLKFSHVVRITINNVARSYVWYISLYSRLIWYTIVVLKDHH